MIYSAKWPDNKRYLQGVEALGTCEDFQLGINTSETFQTVRRDLFQLVRRETRWNIKLLPLYNRTITQH